MDANKDGRIETKELRRILRELGDDFSHKACNRMIKTVDKDGDGLISF
jgi:calcium-binding protein CML